jgi:hypothetical protein
MRSWNFRNATLALFRLACSMYTTARGEYIAATRHARRLRTTKRACFERLRDSMSISGEEIIEWPQYRDDSITIFVSFAIRRK